MKFDGNENLSFEAILLNRNVVKIKFLDTPTQTQSSLRLNAQVTTTLAD